MPRIIVSAAPIALSLPRVLIYSMFANRITLSWL
jgi:hypothetical protein